VRPNLTAVFQGALLALAVAVLWAILVYWLVTTDGA
jgi:hypothetical protein